MSKACFCFHSNFGLVCVSLMFIKMEVWGLKSSVGFWLLFLFQGTVPACCVTQPAAGTSSSHLMPFPSGWQCTWYAGLSVFMVLLFPQTVKKA